MATIKFLEGSASKLHFSIENAQNYSMKEKLLYMLEA